MLSKIRKKTCLCTGGGVRFEPKTIVIVAVTHNRYDYNAIHTV